MRLWAGFAVAVATAIGAACAPRPQAPVVPSPPPDLPSPSPTPVSTPTPAPPAERDNPDTNGDAAPDFARDVQPILARACNPCHFPGGKMYQPMPFDDPNTIASHREGVLRRLKGSDRATAERWLSAGH